MLPLARLLRLLGFQVRFWWTLPYPYHRLIALLLPFVPVAIAGWVGFYLFRTGRSPVSSFDFLLAGLLLAIPLSVPILNMILVAFRVQLLQGFCFLAGMAVLAAEVAVGVRPLSYGLLPLAFFGLFAVQRIAGPRLIARLHAENAAFTPVDPGDRLVHYRLAGSASHRANLARQLFEHFGLAWLATSSRHSDSRSELRFRATRQAAIVLRTMLEPGEFHADVGGLRTDDVQIPSSVDTVTIKTREGRSWLVAGNLTSVTIEDGATRKRLSAGRLAPVGNWPLFVFAYYLSIFSGGPAKGTWLATFLPRREVVLGDRTAHALVEAALVPQNPSLEVSEEDLKALLKPNMPQILRLRRYEQEAKARRTDEAASDLNRWLSGDPTRIALRSWRFLVEQPAKLSGHGPALCARLAQAKAAHDRPSAEIAATLLAALPLQEFVARTVPKRLTGVSATSLAIRSSRSGPLPIIASQIGVMIAAGWTELQRISSPSDAQYKATLLLWLRIAAFDDA
jgi:hypothetical protein